MIHPMREFRETFFGSFEADRSDDVYPKDVETEEEFMVHLESGLEKITQDVQHEHVLVVTHGNAIRHLVKKLH